MDIYKIAVIGLVGATLSMLMKNYRPEFSLYVVIATVLIMFAMILYRLTTVLDFLESVYQQISYGRNFFTILLKVLAVAYIADFVGQVCKDAGESAIADKVELAGKVMIFYLAVPVMMTVLELVNRMLPE